MLKQWLLRRSSEAGSQHLLGYASIAITLDGPSHWIPSMGHHAADGMDEVSS